METENTLELKHLAPYLPYGLKVLCGDGDIRLLDCQYDDSKTVSIYNVIRRPQSHKIYLRSLSKLTQEIEHNGEKFIPTELLDSDEYPIDFFVDTQYEYMVDWIGSFKRDHHILFLPWGLINQLIEWHFDVFGLLEKNQAIEKTL